jgi:hypothetical protein
MAADRPKARVLVLRCQACRTRLPAASNDVAFRCPQCGRGWEISAAGLGEWPALYVMPPKRTAQPLLYLPYWSFTVVARAGPKRIADAAQLTARDRAARYRRAFVSAYAIYRPTYIGEWGLVYTRLQPEWETRSGHGPEAPGAAISSDDAQKIAQHYILAEIDRMADLGTLDVGVTVSDPELWAIPAYDLGDRIRCPWTRGELPAAVLDDLSEIRRATERREA